MHPCSSVTASSLRIGQARCHALCYTHRLFPCMTAIESKRIRKEGFSLMFEPKPKSQPNSESNIELGIYPVRIFAPHTLKLSPLFIAPTSALRNLTLSRHLRPFSLVVATPNRYNRSLAAGTGSFARVP
jgi:hypothetical protein